MDRSTRWNGAGPRQDDGTPPPSCLPPAGSNGTRGSARLSLPFPVTPISAPSNEGDGLELGLKAGAAVADMTAIWGVPVISAPAHEYDGRQSGRMGNVEMTLPGSITVNAAGKRFVNEALNYHDASRVFASMDPQTGRQQNNPAWLVFDSSYLPKYPVAGSTPGPACRAGCPAHLPWRNWPEIGVDPDGLSSTVAGSTQTPPRAWTRNSTAAPHPRTVSSAMPATPQTHAWHPSSSRRSMP